MKLQVVDEKASILARNSIPRIDWAMSNYYFEEAPVKTPKFMSFSVALHLFAAVAVTFVSIMMPPKPVVETISIEFQSPKTPLGHIREVQPKHSIAKATEVTEPKSPPLDPLPQPQEQEPPKPIAAKPMPAKVRTPEPNFEQAALAIPHPQKQSQSFVPKSATSPYPKNVQARSASLEDIDAPDLENTAAVDQKSNINPEVLDQDLDNDFAVINSKQKKKLDQVKRSLEKHASRVASEGEENLNALAEENRIQNQRAILANKAKRAEEGQTLAQTQAEELAAGMEAQKARDTWVAATKKELEEKLAAQAAADQLRAQNARSRARSAAPSARKSVASSGDESVNSGGANHGQPGAGSPQGIRALSDLKQLPGNPRPQYNEQGRVQQQKGTIAFVAYVTKEGQLSNFKIIQSTGHRNLDAISLKALKKWKFYPGQEGWVEIPFLWDMKGDAQEIPARLRVSRNN